MEQVGVTFDSPTKCWKFLHGPVESFSLLQRPSEELLTALVQDLDEAADNLDSFAAMLRPMENQNSSLAEFLLKCDCIQTQVIQLLLERLPEICSIKQIDEALSLARLILRSLSWLPVVCDPQALAMKVLEIIQIIPLEFQKEVISMIPELVSDSEHKLIVSELKGLMEVRSELVPVILDLFSQIIISEDTRNDLFQFAIERLNSVDASMIPSLVKFLLTSSASNEMNQAVIALRNMLQSDHLLDQDSNHDTSCALIDALHVGIQLNSTIRKAWFTIIANNNRLEIIDMAFIVVSMASDPSLRTKVMQLMKNCCHNGSLNLATLHGFFKMFPDISEKFGKSLLEMADILVLTCSGKSSQDFIRRYFNELFRFNPMREMIGNQLVTYIGGVNADQTELSLAVLLSLLKTHGASAFSQMANTIKSLLDYIEAFTFVQAIEMYSILRSVALYRSENYADESFCNELMIVIKKQISHPILQYTLFGVAGSLAFLRKLSDSQLRGDRKKDLDLFALTLKQQSLTVKEILPLMIEKLSSMVCKNELALDVVSWIYENLALDFQDMFVVQRNSLDAFCNEELRFKQWLDHDGEKSGIALNIYPCCINRFERSESLLAKTKNFIKVLCPLFNLLQSCERSENHSLEDIDGLLSCGLIMFNDDQVNSDLSETYVESWCQSLFVAINWIITTVNAFCLEKDGDILERCASRLNDLISLEEKLLSLTEKHQTLDLFQISQKKRPFSIGSSDAKHPKRKRNRPGTTEIHQDEHDSEGNHDRESSVAFSENRAANFSHVTSAMLRSQYSEIELQAFQLLVNEKINSKLSAETVKLLLNDLATKTQFLLCPVFNSPLARARRCKDPHYRFPETIASCEHSQFIDFLTTLVPFCARVINEERNEQLLEPIIRCVDLVSYWQDAVDKSVSEKVKCFLRTLAEASGSTVSGSETFVNLHEKISSPTLQYLNLKIILRQPNSCDSQIEKISRSCLEESSDYLSSDQFVWIFRAFLDKSPRRVFLECVDLIVKNESNEKLEFIKNDKIPMVYKALFSHLGDQLKKQDIDLNDAIELTKVFNDLLGLVKSTNKRVFLASALKHGKVFIESFQHQVIPLIDRKFRTDVQRVNQILKTLQQGTRVLQSICGYSKEHRDLQLASTVPLLKKTLESFIFTIKGLLAKHGALSAFWIGNLKHRNLRGEVVASQIQHTPSDVSSATSDENCDEEEDDEEADIAKHRRLSLVPEFD